MVLFFLREPCSPIEWPCRYIDCIIPAHCTWYRDEDDELLLYDDDDELLLDDDDDELLLLLAACCCCCCSMSSTTMTRMTSSSLPQTSYLRWLFPLVGWLVGWLVSWLEKSLLSYGVSLLLAQSHADSGSRLNFCVGHQYHLMNQ